MPVARLVAGVKQQIGLVVVVDAAYNERANRIIGLLGSVFKSKKPLENAPAARFQIKPDLMRFARLRLAAV